MDTTLTVDQLKQAANQNLGAGFIKWELDIPGYGTVLCMGILGEVAGTKITLGLGTNLRGTEYHRKHELKLV